MATKNLSRTAIEGGRTGYSKLARRQSNRTERAETRQYLIQIRYDDAAADERPPPRRAPERIGFSDKLGPVHRFLATRVGRSWNKTRSLLAERFDTRTTPGRHIMNDHILRDVALTETGLASRGWGKRYFVNRRGLLQNNPTYGTRWSNTALPSFYRYGGVLSWLGSRKVGRQGNRLFWFEPVRDSERIRVSTVHFPRARLRYVLFDADGKELGEVVDQLGVTPGVRLADQIRIGFRQSAPLSPEDDAIIRALPEGVQQEIFRCAPGAL